MALKTPVATEKPEKPEASATVTLELALYTHYTWGGVAYEKGVGYRFAQADAMALLGEMDHGRPIWRQYVAPRKKVAAAMPIVDSTEVRAVRSRLSMEEAALRSGGKAVGKRIEVGTDEEIADVLNRPDADPGGDVTV